jgi:dCMP deaminase
MNRTALKYQTWMNVAIEIAHLSTCLRRSVGCVLLDARGHVIATGVNGVHAGAPHCNEMRVMPRGQPALHPHACSGADAPSGTQLNACQAIHAEQNAIMQCGDVYQIDTCFTTTSPCMTCTKLLLNTSCKRIVYRELYSAEALELWLAAGREIERA